MLDVAFEASWDTKLSANASCLKHRQRETESVCALRALLDGDVSGDKLNVCGISHLTGEHRRSVSWWTLK